MFASRIQGFKKKGNNTKQKCFVHMDTLLHLFRRKTT